MVADITQENSRLGGLREAVGILDWWSISRRPPRIEVASRIASEPRSAPAAVRAAGGLIMQPFEIHCEPLHEESGPPSDNIVLVCGELLEELLVAKKSVRRPGSVEQLEHAGLLIRAHGKLNLTPGSPRIPNS